MRYTRISADCHIDLPWIPPDLFTSNASAEMKARMPYVTDGADGPYWTCKNGGSSASRSARAGSAGSPMRSTGWTSSGRTVSATSDSR